MRYIDEEEKTSAQNAIACRNIHCPVILVLDTSHSMWGNGLKDMQASLHEFHQTLQSEMIPHACIDIAAVSMGDNLGMLEEFTPFPNSRLHMLNIRPKGSTPIGGALELALGRLEKQKEAYRTQGTPYATPHLILLSDGRKSSDDFSGAAQKIRNACAAGELFCRVIPMGSSPDYAVLTQIGGTNVIIPRDGKLLHAFADVGRDVSQTYVQEARRCLPASTPSSAAQPAAAARKDAPSSTTPSAPHAASQPREEEEIYLLDGTNIMMWDKLNSGCDLRPLLSLTEELTRRNKNFYVFFDASTPHILRKGKHPEQEKLFHKLLQEQSNQFKEVPAGRQADNFLLQTADNYQNALIISNDRYRDHIQAHPWLKQAKEQGRLLKGMIVGNSLCINGENTNFTIPLLDTITA
ncbi:MAG: VWA domain-containing protein [Oligosphaeraceae bacterium]